MKKKTPAKTKRPKPLKTAFLYPAQAYAFVTETAQLIDQLIGQRLQGIDPNQHWLLNARIKSFLFGAHFRPSLQLAQKGIDLVEAEHKARERQ